MRFLTTIFALLIHFAGLSFAVPTDSTNLPTVELKEWTLPNGLHVIFSPFRRVPAVTVQIWYHVGSKDEHPGIRGVAHMFEHMMFKGSRHVSPEQHSQLQSALGGIVNAFTTEDVTAYHNTLPRQYLDFAIQLEAERMQNLLLIKKTVDSEREVVKEEKRLRLENSPIGRSLEAINALAYKKHPYQWTPAGDIPDLDRVTPKDCQDFYDKFYVPNNATLVIVGDVTEAEVRESVKKHFAPIARKKDPPRVKIAEPPQEKEREQIADWPSQLTVVLGAYHIPAVNHPDISALSVLSTILSEGHSSRLHQKLVRKEKMALAAGGFVRGLEHPGLFFIYGIGLSIHDLGKMKDALIDEVENIATEGVTDEELTKAKNQMVTQYLTDLETLNGLAIQIGMSTYLYGDPRAFLKEVEKLDKVTKEDVKRVTSTYLKLSNLSFVLLPAEKGGEQ